MNSYSINSHLFIYLFIYLFILFCNGFADVSLRALYTIPLTTPMFWQKISRKVGTRTAQECQFQHQGQYFVSSKKNSSVKKGPAKKKKDPGQKGTTVEYGILENFHII